MARSRPKKPRPKAPAKRKHGGRRAGSGRPRDRLPDDVVKRLGAIPADATPEAIDLWVRRLLAELVVLQMTGRVSVTLAASIRATCGEIRRNLPEAKPKDDSDDEDDDQEEEGPELEEDEEDTTTEGADDGSLRVG